MKLQDIGFYTLEDYRAENLDINSPLWRCELLITDKCNFKCPYCRGMREDMKGTISRENAIRIINMWADQGLKNIRFSGGEPTLYPYLSDLIILSKEREINRIALSTNGSADFRYYEDLIKLGVNDFSISLDSCCSAFGEKMNGGIKGIWNKVIENIRELSKLTYVTVGMVFNELNVDQSLESILFADSLGVSDIRIISSAQFNKALTNLDKLSDEILDKYPILKYRVMNFRKGRNLRGIRKTDSKRCYLVIDDMAIANGYHFPCIIYLRELGDPIGKINNEMRQDRIQWALTHNCHEDHICRNNCLDVCIDYNNKVREFMKGE